MKPPNNAQFYQFASDVSGLRPDVRQFLLVGNYILSLHWKDQRRILSWLNDVHPNFRRQVASVLPRLDSRAFYGR